MISLEYNNTRGAEGNLIPILPQICI